MQSILQPWQLLLWAMAGWVQRGQQEEIDYLRTEVAVLKEKLGKRRILLSDDQRRRLAVNAKVLGRKRLQEVDTLFTPDTILRWHRQLVARKWDYSERKEKRQGRPRVRQVIVDLALKFANENPSWGCDRIQGALANVGYKISEYDGREYPESPRHRAGSATEEERLVGGLFEGSLGRARIGRLYDRVRYFGTSDLFPWPPEKPPTPPEASAPKILGKPSPESLTGPHRAHSVAKRLHPPSPFEITALLAPVSLLIQMPTVYNCVPAVNRQHACMPIELNVGLSR